MKHLVIIVFLSRIVSGHCELGHAEAKELCPVKCTCEVKAKDRIFANCSKRNYTSIPARFPKLYSLNFSHNQISEVKNVNFEDGNLHDIQYIDLSNNLIQNIETKSFEHLTQLRHLNLSSNKITSVTPESFKTLKKLEILDLHGNSIDCIALKNELSGVNIPCSSSEEYAYGTTMPTATLTKASDSNMGITEVSYTDDTIVTTVTLSTESSNRRSFDSETVTKANMNDTEMQNATSTKNYNSSIFGVTQITHGVAADQQPSKVPAINEEKSAGQIVIITCVLLAFLLIGVCGGMYFWRHKCKYTKVQTDPEGSSCFSSITT